MPLYAIGSLAMLLAIGSTVLAGAAAAETLASPWQPAAQSRLRLVAGTLPPPGQHGLYAGVEIELDAGWKTYWRMPGDAGVPPNFDWSKSTNLAAARVL